YHPDSPHVPPAQSPQNATLKMILCSKNLSSIMQSPSNMDAGGPQYNGSGFPFIASRGILSRGNIQTLIKSLFHSIANIPPPLSLKFFPHDFGSGSLIEQPWFWYWSGASTSQSWD